VILWVISASTPLPLFGHDFSFPGYLIVIAFCYACIGTTIAHFVGRRLIDLNFKQQRREADLRFATARVTDRSEQVALVHAEPVERSQIRRCIDALIVNWTALVAVQSNLTGFVYGYLQSSVVFPMLVVTPAYLTGHITLGVLMQAALAFQKVESCFSFMVSTYSKFAEWKASMDRLWQLEVALQQVDEPGPAAPQIVREPQPDLSIAGLVMRLPSGEPIAAVPDLTLTPGDRLLVSGPSGAGKSVLFRILTGIWPFCSGRIDLPREARVMALSSRPYFPLGTLRVALAMPAPVAEIEDAVIRAAMAAVGIGDLAERLDDEDEWSTTLSGGQQQRLGFARVLIHRPDVLLLDDAVSALEDHEMRELYRLVTERLPSTIVISSGRNGELVAMHQLNIELGAAPKLPRSAAMARAHVEVIGPAAAPAIG
jgi:putative ATP-binding cassette transporter